MLRVRVDLDVDVDDDLLEEDIRRGLERELPGTTIYGSNKTTVGTRIVAIVDEVVRVEVV